MATQYSKYFIFLAAVILLAGCGGSSGPFKATTVALCGDTQVRAVFADDFNGDGADDIAAGCRTRHDPLKGHVEIWLSDGSGGMHKAQSLPLGSFKTGGEGAGPITAADFNEDGNPDLVITDTGGTTHGISLLYGKGDGTFGQPTYYKRSAINAVATSDVNGDGHQDMLPIVSGFGSGASHYIPGDGSRLDAGARMQLVAHDTRGYKDASFGDFNGDRATDVVIPEPRAGRLHVFTSGGKAHDIVLGKAVRQVQRVLSGADVDGDGKTDLLVATRRQDGGNDTRWLLTKGGPHLSAPLSAVPTDATRVRAADFNGDGVTDLLVGQGYKPKLKYHGGAHPLILIGKQDGGFKKPIKLDLPGSPGGEVLADLNGDGKTDFVYQRISDKDPQGAVYLSTM